MTCPGPTAHSQESATCVPTLGPFSLPWSSSLFLSLSCSYHARFPPQKLLPCETKPVSLQEIMATQQNGCVKSVAEASELTLGPTCPHHVPVQVEQDEEPAAPSLDHCTIEISELETNV